MNEFLSQPFGPERLRKEYEYYRDGTHAALTELKKGPLASDIHLAAEQLLEYRTLLLERHAEISSLLIDAGMVDEWIDFIREDERAYWRVLEDLYTDEYSLDDEEIDGSMLFPAVTDEYLQDVVRIHLSQFDTNVSQLDANSETSLDSKQYLAHQFGHRIDAVIDSFVMRLPRTSLTAIKNEEEIRMFRDTVDQFESPLDLGEFPEPLTEVDAYDPLATLQNDAEKDLELGRAYKRYLHLNKQLTTSLTQLSELSPIQVFRRNDILHILKQNIKDLTEHFGKLSDTIYVCYPDESNATAIMAALWKQDSAMRKNLIETLSDGMTDGKPLADAAIEYYADILMHRGENTSDARVPNNKDIRDYYASSLDRALQEIQKTLAK